MKSFISVDDMILVGGI